MKQTVFGFHPKRKIANRINRLVRFLYKYGIKVGFDKRFSDNDKFALLEFDNEVRKSSQKLFDAWDSNKEKS